MDKAVAIFSGGMDSATMVYMLHDLYSELHLLSFDYGQRHRKELKSAAKIAAHLEGASAGAYTTHDIVNLRSITGFLTGSALTDDVSVPDGHYTEEAARVTVVPNRNMIMLAVATAVAVARNADAVYTGVHAGDHFVYPDCRPEFLHHVNLAAQTGNDSFAKSGFRIEAPFLHMEKSEIVKVGHKHSVPWQDTWSCYKGGNRHCGTCPTCVERAEAFYIAGVHDPTPYVVRDFWRGVSQLPEFEPQRIKDGRQ